jgi:hypothetical protein
MRMYPKGHEDKTKENLTDVYQNVESIGNKK